MALERIRIFKVLVVQKRLVFLPISPSFSTHSFGVFRFDALSFNVTFSTAAFELCVWFLVSFVVVNRGKYRNQVRPFSVFISA
ncbi:hypothetical protein [Vibrio hibernica]|uniref:hypothetical protein n=1 Tax=Vibrio hibernica TaxID=2587465 RepID=UPI001881FC2C|nr:hypothetical protein [Vibrio hibernica]